ncbi:MAG TPA: hypothetical protein GXX17_03210 [Clostridiales bacterium]|nr:hypothetical protein [Clostridiales bacterium]
MLKFIFGRASSGKTTTIINRICDEVNKQKQVILLVPEQFTFESEKTLLKYLGYSVSDLVEVLSFSRLVDRIGRDIGGIAGKRLDDSGRFIIMGRAINSIKSQLNVLTSHTDSPEFIKMMATTVAELKQAAVNPDLLLNAAGSLPSSALRAKISDVALIMAAYDSCLGRTFIDPADSLTVLYKRLADYPFFKGKSVYIDSFKGFTAQQLLLLDRIIQQADNVTVSLCTDGDIYLDDNLGLFANVNSTAKTLENLAKKHDTGVDTPVVLNKSYFNSRALCILEENLFNPKAKTDELASEDITVCRAENIYKEADFVARTIHKLVREEGYRYRDIVVIARDAESYQGILDTAFEHHNIPLYMDKRRSAEHLPLMVFAVSALNAASRFETDDILKYLKTQLTDINEEEINLLENYCFIWSINRKQWLEPFKFNPDGFESRGDDNSELLQVIEDIRQRAVNPLVRLKKCFAGGKVEDMARGVYELLLECRVPEHLQDYTNALRQQGQNEYADLQGQSWEALINLLDGLCACLQGEYLSDNDFIKYFENALFALTLGTISQNLDQVTFGSADRVRPSRPKVTFIIGANQGVFPKVSENTGLFSIRERQRLIELGLPISDRYIQEAIDENFLLYTAVCSPSEKLFVSYYLADLNGEIKEPSILIDKLLSIFPKGIKVIEETGADICLEKIEARRPAFELLAANWNRQDGKFAALYKYFREQEEYRDRLEAIENFQNRDRKLDPQTAKRLYGTSLYISPSRVDMFYRCSFSYFCRYGLKARVIRPAEIDVMLRGTIVHYVLENIIRIYGKRLADLSAAERNDCIDRLIEDYLNEFLGGREYKSRKFLFLLEKISVMLKSLVANIADEFKVSLFEPVACELEIDYNSLVKPVKISLPGGAQIAVGGVVDRVDMWQDGVNKYVRVIDYKTGSRRFYLADVLYGLNLQMLLYLFTIAENGQGVFSNARPAGILYMPSKRVIPDEDSADEVNLKMNGLLIADEHVLKAMETSAQCKYIPVKYDKSGDLIRRNSSLIETENLQIIKEYIFDLIKRMGTEIYSGKIDINPLDGRDLPACKYCDYRPCCKREQNEINGKVPQLNNQNVINILTKGEHNGI